MLEGCACGAHAVCEARPAGHLSLALMLEYQKSVNRQTPNRAAKAVALYRWFLQSLCYQYRQRANFCEGGMARADRPISGTPA